MAQLRTPLIRRGGLTLVFITLVIFSPGLLTLAWHVRHGGFIEFKNRRVPVPLLWYGHVDFYSVEVRKVRLDIFSWILSRPTWFFANVTAKPSAVSYQETYISFEKGFWTSVATDDVIVTGPIRFGNSEFDGICMQSVSKRRDPGFAHVSCLLCQGTWGADFSGNEGDVNTFLGIVREIR